MQKSRQERAEGPVILVGGSGDGSVLQQGLAVAEQSDGEVLDVSGPLRRQLEELDVVPLHSVYGHWWEQRRK